MTYVVLHLIDKSQTLQYLEEKLSVAVSDGATYGTRVNLLGATVENHSGQLFSHSKILGEFFTKTETLSAVFQRTRILAAVAISLAALSLLVWLAVMLVLLGG